MSSGALPLHAHAVHVPPSACGVVTLLNHGREVHATQAARVPCLQSLSLRLCGILNFISLRNRPIAAEDVKRNIKVLQCAVMVYPAVVPSKYTLAADLVEFDCKLNGFV